MSDGAAWKRSRSKLRSIFSKKTSLDETKQIRPHFEQLCENARKQQGKIIDFRVILGFVADVLFGQSTKSLSEDGDGPRRHFLSLVKKFKPPSGTFTVIVCFGMARDPPVISAAHKRREWNEDIFRTQLRAGLTDVSRASITLPADDGKYPVFRAQSELQSIFFLSVLTLQMLFLQVD